jgi:hypothetical protein
MHAVEMFATEGCAPKDISALTDLFQRVQVGTEVAKICIASPEVLCRSPQLCTATNPPLPR